MFVKVIHKKYIFRGRVDIIHDLMLETATTRIKVTPDEEYVITSGTYPSTLS